MKAKKICLALFLLITVLFLVSCEDKKDNGIDMKKFIQQMQKENNVSAEKKKEIRKSIFPNLKEKE